MELILSACMYSRCVTLCDKMSDMVISDQYNALTDVKLDDRGVTHDE